MNIVVELKLERETPGTYRYDNEDRDGAIKSVYIQKSSIKGNPPERVQVTIKPRRNHTGSGE